MIMTAECDGKNLREKSFLHDKQCWHTETRGKMEQTQKIIIYDYNGIARGIRWINSCSLFTQDRKMLFEEKGN